MLNLRFIAKLATVVVRATADAIDEFIHSVTWQMVNVPEFATQAELLDED